MPSNLSLIIVSPQIPFAPGGPREKTIMVTPFEMGKKRRCRRLQMGHYFYILWRENESKTNMEVVRMDNEGRIESHVKRLHALLSVL